MLSSTVLPYRVPLSIKNFLGLTVPEPDVLWIIGQESKQKGTKRLIAKPIDGIIKAARKSKRWWFRFGL